jgi:ketosteroid isomerase-like protein
VTPGSQVTALTRPEELCELLDPDVMWYSVDVDSNDTCNGSDAAIACIERAVADGLPARTFELFGERDDFVVVRPVFDPPRPERQLCLLLRFRDGLIAEMRDFADAATALAYAGIA